MDYSWLLLAAVPVTGFIAGFINTLAGSGSLVTLPILIVLGLPANVANGTNRVGVLLQNIVAVATLRRHGTLESAGHWQLIVATIVGSVLGAELAIDLDEALLRRTIAVLMLLMLVIVIAKPERWLGEHATGRRTSLWIQVPLFFAIGIYGGFIQAGVGIFLLAGLVLGAGMNLLTANAVKNVIVLLFTVAALAVFVINDQVRWDLGLLLALGQGLGAWVAARLAIAHGAPFVRWSLIAILVLSAAALFSGVTL